MFIDTHCHLTFPDFADDIADVVSRANDVGIEKIIVPSISLETSYEAIELAEKFDSVFASVGVHPQDSQQFENQQIEAFHDLAEHPKVVAIGEIGLDYYRDYAPHFVQKEVLRRFLELSADVNLPVIIHNRAAFSDLIEILEESKFVKTAGVFHCFSEDEVFAQQLIKIGFVVSFTGTVTFKKSKSAQIAQKIKLEKQLLETDAPFMAPVPNRGKRNEPAFIKDIAEKQAELHQISVEKVGKITTDLAIKTFPRLKN